GCFDRIVITVGPDAGPPGYRAGYVDAVRAQGSGEPVPLDGAARLQIVIDSPSYDAQTGAATYDPGDAQRLAATDGFAALRQIASGGSFEGQTTIGIGVVGRLPYSVSTLPGPGSGGRVVIDVAHP